MNKVCFSGGADGADLAWGGAARRHDYDVVHYSFPGHLTRANRDELLVLSDEQLRAANRYLAETATSIGRHWPPKSAYVRKLLQRNFWQVRQTQAVYAVANLRSDGSVEGGTAWAIGMYLSCGLARGLPDCFIFDERHEGWFRWRTGEGWRPVTRVPPPPNFFTGIGSRAVGPAGLRAIEEVFN